MRSLMLVLIVCVVLAVGASYAIWKNFDGVASSGQRPQVSGKAQGHNSKPENQPAIAQDKAAAGEPTARVEGEARIHVSLPEELREVQFGMPPAAATERFPPAWRKETRELLTLVHYPDESRSTQYHFEFAASRLVAVEVRFKARDGEDLSGLYKRVQRQAAGRFESPPGTPRTSWRDDRLTARLRKGGNYVAIRFTPRQ